MIVGKYTVSDWDYLLVGSYHYRFVNDPTDTNTFTNSFQIGVHNREEGWKVLIYNDEFYKLYCSMTLDKTIFDTVEQAKQSADLFLDKMSKLKAFL